MGHLVAEHAYNSRQNPRHQRQQLLRTSHSCLRKRYHCLFLYNDECVGYFMFLFVCKNVFDI